MILNGSAPQDVMGRSPPIVNVLPFEDNVSGSRRVYPGQKIEKGGFARAVGPDYGMDFPRVDQK